MEKIIQFTGYNDCVTVVPAPVSPLQTHGNHNGISPLLIAFLTPKKRHSPPEPESPSRIPTTVPFSVKNRTAMSKISKKLKSLYKLFSCYLPSIPFSMNDKSRVSPFVVITFNSDFTLKSMISFLFTGTSIENSLDSILYF